MAKFRQAAKATKNVHIVYQPRRRPNIVQFDRPPVSNIAGVMKPRRQNQLKFAGVPQTGKPISAISEPKFAILRKHLEEILVFNKFFSNCQYMP